MNKHQLASTIWESANQMHSKIEANEYKGFKHSIIFGFTGTPIQDVNIKKDSTTGLHRLIGFMAPVIGE